jgi:cytochrome c5
VASLAGEKNEMKRRQSVYVSAVLVAVGAVTLWIGGERVFAGTKSDAQSQVPSQIPQKSADQRGEIVFMENCSRCHKPPMSIPPRITGTVIMHMRVRAKLSRKDEQALLNYLAP